MGRGKHRDRLERIRQAVELRLLGKTQNEIAEEMGVCRKTVYNYLDEASSKPDIYYPQETAWLRGHLWQKINELLNSNELKPHQKARCIVDLLRSLEPIQARIESIGEQEIGVTWLEPKRREDDE